MDLVVILIKNIDAYISTEFYVNLLNCRRNKNVLV